MESLDANGISEGFKTRKIAQSFGPINRNICDIYKVLTPLDYHSPRLRGGVAFEDKEDEMKCPLKSPFHECKSIMEQFDQILAAYKSSLGPCGEATCPYSQSMMQDNCRKNCRSGKVQEEPPKEECEGVPCENRECPFREKKRFEAGCGFPNCAYSKYKLGLVDQDASLEYMMLPPAISGRCGSPNCDYPLTPDLPPIHWDCPDPLPKGVCKNPNCPLQPPDLRKLKVPTKKKICSCQDCPYAFPPPCGLPSCPFRENPCPFLEKLKGQDDGSCSSNSPEEQEEDACSNPSCPFAPEGRGESKLDDTKLKGELVSCDNPNCPFAQSSSKRRSKKAKKKDSGYSEKPRSSKPTKIDICGNPKCPYGSYPIQSDDNNSPLENLKNIEKRDSDCANPNCPYRKREEVRSKTRDEFCDSDNFCGNPNCSYHNRRSLESVSEECLKPEADCNEDKETCESPNCPFQKDGRGKADDQSLCYYADENNNESPQDNAAKPDTIVVENEIIINNEQNVENPEKRNAKKTNKPQENKPRTKKKRGKFVYSMGNMYPGVKIGHRECVTQVFNVPPKMGWLWNEPHPIVRLKPRRGWKPGALTRSIAARIRAHRQAKGLGMLRVPKFTESRDLIGDQVANNIKVIPRPTLHIQKKEGTYSIVMNPLKDPKTLVDNEDPYMDCTPMRFKISPSKNKKTGSQTCFCDGEDAGEVTSSSDSELDIEFTPPAGIIHPERFKRKLNVIHCDTQYNPEDFTPAEVPKKEKGDKKGGKDKKGKGEKDKKGKGGKGGKGKKRKK